MEMLCAECGCEVDAGVRVASCGNRECCCRALPARELTEEGLHTAVELVEDQPFLLDR